MVQGTGSLVLPVVVPGCTVGSTLSATLAGSSARIDEDDRYGGTSEQSARERTTKHSGRIGSEERGIRAEAVATRRAVAP
jgi:hypothetical protein